MRSQQHAMGSLKEAEESSTSTLVLVHDAEYDLHASRSSIVFPRWGSRDQAKGRNRVVQFSVSLLPRSLDEASTVSSASVPLVFTAPCTPRFQLHGASLTPLLRVGSPLQFETEFVPPHDQDDPDFASSNFQDHIVIQTRLAKLFVRLCAVREGTSTDAVAPDSFVPRVLPTVIAPYFKLFDQIERDASVSHLAASPSHRVSISASFHSHRKADSLAPLPPRQLTPPQPCPTVSRPSSSSSHRRTPSPRVLETLAVLPTVATAVVDNQAEAREVILRLRARRSALHSTTAKPINKIEQHQPTGPESQLDANAKAELDKFHELVKAAKMNVAGERSKAKQELDFYKSLLPGQPSTSIAAAGLPVPLPIEQDGGQGSSRVVHRGIPKKSVRLPALPHEGEAFSNELTHERHVVDKPTSTATNQESSPVKRSHANVLRATATKPAHTPKALRIQTPPLTKQAPPSRIHAVAKSLPVASSKLAASKALAKAPTTQAAPAPTKTTRQSTKAVQKLAVVIQRDDTLDDFDDEDPEIDDAPVLPDDLRATPSPRDPEDDNDDDPMLTMKVPLH